MELQMNTDEHSAVEPQRKAISPQRRGSTPNLSVLLTRKSLCFLARDFCEFWERTHPACGELETLSTLEACAPRDDLRVLCGREKKCSAGFQPANGPVDAKGVIQAHMFAKL